MVDLIRLMEIISASEDVLLYGEDGSDMPLSDDEVDTILKALADMAARVVSS